MLAAVLLLIASGAIYLILAHTSSGVVLASLMFLLLPMSALGAVGVPWRLGRVGGALGLAVGLIYLAWAISISPEYSYTYYPGWPIWIALE